MNEHKYPYRWTLADANFTKDKGSVFSCFSCGGGSTMGYKLAGFDVIGCCEIDQNLIDIYCLNHKPKHRHCRKVKGIWNSVFVTDEMKHLDILDGSPPCSSFSLAGNRDSDWGKKKKFKEGQQAQVLDMLFFDFIEVAKHWQPKVVVAENVIGILMGKARQYVKRIYQEFDEAGYILQHWELDASKMGVPQERNRVFFIALRKDLCEPFMDYKDMFTNAPKLDLRFNEAPIKFGEVRGEKGIDRRGTERGQLMTKHFIFGDKNLADINLRVNKKNSGFNSMIRYDHEVCGTITAGERDFRAYDKLACSIFDYCVCGTFPLDYQFGKNTDNEDACKYMIGMSVPPVMTAQIASRIWEQWLSKL